jgi:hypothetical protein
VKATRIQVLSRIAEAAMPDPNTPCEHAEIEQDDRRHGEGGDH